MKVSILTLVYNHESYLNDFFNGILSQDLAYEYECIIGVDKGTDASLDICKVYQSKYPSIFKIIEHHKNVGMFNNFISVINECKGEYIAICEGDDYWIDKDKLADQINVLDNEHNMVLCFTDIKCYDHNTKAFSCNWAKIEKSFFTITDLIKNNFFSTCTVLFRKSAINFSLSGIETLPMVDWPLYINLLLSGNAAYLKKTTAVYRMSNDSSYSKNSILQQLRKKQLVYSYLISAKNLFKYKPDIYLNLFINKYAIAVRLEKSNLERRMLLKEIIFGVLDHRNITLFAKAIIRFM